MNFLDRWAFGLMCDFDPDQPRDDEGKWTSGFSTENNERKKRIEELQQKNIELMRSDYTGCKNWQKQLETRAKQAKKNNEEINKLERQIKKEAQSRQESEKQPSGSEKQTMKWTTAQKEEYANGFLKPRIIKSGNYEIRGKSTLNVFYSGQKIGVAGTLLQAKQIAERHKTNH